MNSSKLRTGKPLSTPSILLLFFSFPSVAPTDTRLVYAYSALISLFVLCFVLFSIAACMCTVSKLCDNNICMTCGSNRKQSPVNKQSKKKQTRRVGQPGKTGRTGQRQPSVACSVRSRDYISIRLGTTGLTRLWCCTRMQACLVSVASWLSVQSARTDMSCVIRRLWSRQTRDLVIEEIGLQ